MALSKEEQATIDVVTSKLLGERFVVVDTDGPNPPFLIFDTRTHCYLLSRWHTRDAADEMTWYLNQVHLRLDRSE